MSRGRIRRNDYYEAAVSILTEMGLSFREQTGRKHGKIYVTIGDVERLIPISGSPSDRRGILNFKAEVKRNIRIWKAEAEGLVATPASALHQSLEIDEVQHSMELQAAASPLVFEKDGIVVANSRDVASTFQRRHADILRAVDKLECSKEFRERNFALTEATEKVGATYRSVRSFNMTKDGFAFLVMGFTGKEAARFKEAYIQRFNEMEQTLKAREAIPVPTDDIGAVVDLMSEFNAIVVAMQSRVDAIHDLLAAGDAVNVPVLRQQLWAAVKWEDQQFRAALNETVRAVLGGQKKVLANPDTWRKAGVLPAPHGEDHEFCTTYELLCEVFEPDRIHARLTTWVTNEILMPAARDGLWPQGRTPVRSRSDRPLVTFPLVRAREYLQRKDVRKKVLAKNEELARGSVQGVVIDMFAGQE